MPQVQVSLLESTKGEPEVGEIRTGYELGRRKGNGSGRYIWLPCVDCGKLRWVLLRDGKPDSLRCRKCAIRNRPAPEHTRDALGYVYVRLSPNLEFFRPMVKKNSNYVYEHRLVMAQYLKRCLLPWEVVHHKNGIKDDNRLENLALLPNRQVHMVDTVVKAYIHRLQNKIEEQARQIKLLQSRLGG